MESNEKFDSIYISSQESDIEIEFSRDKIKTSQFLYSTNVLDNKPSISVDEDSNDSDDVTFIKNISKPLIKKHQGKNEIKHRMALHKRQYCVKVAGIFFIVTFLITLIFFFLVIMTPPKVLQKIQHSIVIRKIKQILSLGEAETILGCDALKVETIWMKQFPLMLSEGSIRLLNVNNDDILDLIIPFGTNVRNTKSMQIACKIYFPNQNRCFGGLLALDGKTGDVLWRYDSTGEMYAATCQEDLNGDGWIDCLGAGRQGSFGAVNGRDGSTLWEFDASEVSDIEGSDDDRYEGFVTGTIMNLYTAQFIEDVDGDGVRDIIQIHGGDPVAKPNELNRLVAKVMVFSGRTGTILQSISVPDYHESYYSPQILNLGDGNLKVLVGTGGETYSGNLYTLKLLPSTFHGSILSTGSLPLDQKHNLHQLIYKGRVKGVMTPPVLVDLNKDGRVDIVICPFGNECVAIDGVTFQLLWKFDKINNSETYISPASGYYNTDDVPDIFIQLFVGLGYPVYFYGETVILDGRNGEILKWVARSNNVVTSSPLTISMEGQGNDLFLYWLQLCEGHESDIDRTPFENVPQYMLSRADVCRIRFNTTTKSVYQAYSRHLTNSNEIYNSLVDHPFSNESRSSSEITTQLIMNFLGDHPEYIGLYERYRQLMNDQSIDDIDDGSRGSVDLLDDSVHSDIDFDKAGSTRAKRHNGPHEGRGSVDKTGDIKLTRMKRHNGPHDSDGQQRLISTGTLAPSSSSSSEGGGGSSSIDVVFSTYWSTPHEVSLQTKLERQCNKEWASKESAIRFKLTNNKFKEYDHDHYLEYGSKYCAEKYGERKKMKTSNNNQGPSIFNIHSGQLSVFRKRLYCTCTPSRILDAQKQQCAKIKPFSEQSWPGYLGLAGDSYWNNSQFLFNRLKSFVGSV